jgi:DNA-binding Lrp family transcriptional regulator
VTLIRTEAIRIVDQYKSIRENTKLLDSTNIKILTMMAKVGPRNLLEVSRQCGIPFRTVYNRIEQIEAKSGKVAKLIPNVAKIGLVRVNLLVTARAGQEERTRKALKIPNLWRSVETCEGAFTHHSIQIVPNQLLQGFREFISAMSDVGLIKNHRIVLTGDSVQNFPDFSSYNPRRNEWTFDWEGLLNDLKVGRPDRTIEDPSEPVLRVDKTDLQIIENLEMNARANFKDIANDVGVSPQTVKYRYDTKLLPSGLVDQFNFLVVPYPMEMAAYHEVMLQFTSNNSMNKFFSLVRKLFFVIAVSKALQQNALFVRTYLPNSQVSEMFEFCSQMAEADLIEDYSAVRLDLARRDLQTISSELFDNDKGWIWDLNDCLAKLRELCSEN